MNFLIAPQKAYILVCKNRKKPCTTGVCKCRRQVFIHAIICPDCNQVLPAMGPALGDETIAQLDDMYKGYAEP